MKDFRKRNKIESEDPVLLLIYSSPKVGKTEALTKLPDNFVFDFDGSLGFYEHQGIKFPKDMSPMDKYKLFINTFNELKEYTQKEGKFNYISLDTITEFYDGIANTGSIIKYNAEENANLKITDDITRKVSYGGGYAAKRNFCTKTIEKMLELANHVIITGHIADKSVNKDTNTLDVADIDLEGKFKNILGLKVDALGIIYRAEPKLNKIMFNTSIGITAGTRSKHLRNKVLDFSELQEDGTLKTYWDKIFIDK